MTATLALWISIFLNGLAQVLLKKGVGSTRVQTHASTGWWLSLFKSGWVWAWGLCFVAATALWILALSRLDISYAFPLLSSSFILVAILSRLLLGEYISHRRWIAILVICLGVILIAAK
jgi:drug/metabolite transporter (DMT)-like permease